MAGAIKKNRHRETWSTFLCLLLPCLSETVLSLEYRSDELLKLKILSFFYNYAVFFFFFVNEGSASSVNSSNENYYHYVSHTAHHHNFFGNNAFHSLAFFIVDHQVAIIIIYSISCFIEMRPYELTLS